MTTTCKLGVCTTMAAETDIDILLCYYNALINKINNNTATAEDKTCMTTLAAQIISVLQEKTSSLTDPTRFEIDAPEINKEIIKLLGDRDEQDSTVLKDMYKSNAMVFLIVFLILLTIYILI